MSARASFLVEKQSRPRWSRLLNRPSQFAMDGVVLALAFLVSYLLRFEFAIPDARRIDFLVQFPLVLLLQFGAM